MSERLIPTWPPDARRALARAGVRLAWRRTGWIGPAWVYALWRKCWRGEYPDVRARGAVLRAAQTLTPRVAEALYALGGVDAVLAAMPRAEG